jgi:carboxylesterase type B
MSNVLQTSFGTFKGKKGDGIVQYRGIRYASVPDQLSVPELVTTYGTDVVDATRYGYVFHPPFNAKY